ncbi:hemolysin family protein [Pseudoprimorskyibacter insulae]|uniref:Hemolysin C n=1 Tax=Pseudoprimorskyibacter insulae TaxID=1695997 RepID=A0A2R8AYB2_9RHOB|nr:hemolysin family protein [Pseudoprimorskyibacter insulae]SPF81021.1 Hemolysin C [Pseudoprimorskyibacter insulae]
MGDNDGSSNAAQSAQPKGQQVTKRPLLGRLLKRWTPTPEPAPQSAAPVTQTRPQTHGMVNLRRMRVEDVAIPRVEIISVPDTISRDDLVQVFRDSGLTRVPVYEGTLDTPIGLAHLKDFALHHGFNGHTEDFDLRKLLRPLLFVPPSMPIGVLLTKMQAERRHMALVIDEYGGVDGLVTIEDLIEQVIGEIEDEHDIDDEKNWTREKSGAYLVLARTMLDEFEREIGVDLCEDEAIDSEEIDTLGGLVFMLAGHVPARGEVVSHPAGVEFEVIDADPRRIKRLRVVPPGTVAARAAPKAAAPDAAAPKPAGK